MKKIGLLAAAAAVAVAGLPATANAGGYVGLTYDSTDVSSSDVDTWQGEAAFGHAAGGWGFQVDGSFGNTDAGSGSDFDHYGLAGHLYWQGGSWRVGGVIAATNLDAGGGSDVDEIVYGAEGTFDFGPSTVFGWSGTFGEVDSGGSDIDSWNLDASLNHYFSPNFRIGGTLGTGNLEASGSDVDTFTAGIGGEFQLSSLPLSFTAGYSHFEVDSSGLDSDSFTIGARWNFGGGTLQERDDATPFDTRTALFGRLFDIR